MNGRSVLVAFAALTGLASAASAQFTITPGGANSGIGTFQNGVVPSGITGTGSATANLRPGNATSTPDSLFQAWWWFRGPGDTREFAFGNGASGSLSVSGVLVGDNTGNLDTGGYDFTVTNSGYSFTSAQRWQIFNPSNTAGTNVQVLASNTITNTGGSAATFSLFYYMDFDVGAATTNSASLVGPNTMSISGGSGNVVEWAGVGADAYQVTTYSTLRGLLANAFVDDLNNTGLPFNSADFTGAFQWNITLDPGASITLYSGFTLNGPALPAPGAGLLLGGAGLLALRRRRA